MTSATLSSAVGGPTFSTLGLMEPICRAAEAEGYTTPTPIQQKAVGLVLEGRDLLACAQTGTGKTAAFAMPILHRLASTAHPAQRRAGHPRCLVLTPTRELAVQVSTSFRVYGKNLPLKNTAIFGGVGMENQRHALRSGQHIIVATPGRLLDFMNQGEIDLSQLEIFVLDEADRMLDMGFIHDVRRVLKALPKTRQNLLFSATMEGEVETLARGFMNNPARVAVTPVSSTTELVTQSIYMVDRGAKRDLLLHVLKTEMPSRALIFSRTKHGANKLGEILIRAGHKTDVIHGNKSQGARQRALENFRSGATKILVASDVAARGIDIDGITHVINFELTEVPETYVHRIGRAGRAGVQGVAISFCSPEEVGLLRGIERLIKKPVPVVADHPYTSSRDARPQGDMRRGPSGPPRGGSGFGTQGSSRPRSGPGGFGSSMQRGPRQRHRS